MHLYVFPAFFLSVLLLADCLLEERVFSNYSSPYSTYLINTFPVDLHGKRLRAFRQHDDIAQTLNPYSEFVHPDTGIVQGYSSSGRVSSSGLALNMLIEGWLYHMRALDSVNVVTQMSNQVCSRPTSAKATFKIISQIYERNLPFQVFCGACQVPSTTFGPTFFYVLEQRTIYFNNASNLLPECVFLHQFVPSNAMDESTNAGQVYAMERHIDQEMDELGQNSASQLQKALGELRVNPSLLPALKGMSIGCSRQSDKQGNERPMDVLFHMDTLAHPDPIDAIKAKIAEDSASQKVKDRFRVGDLEPFNARQHAKLLPVYRAHLNLKLDLRWNEWSCCSACCCSKAICGFNMSPILCQQMDSFRTRLGYVSFLKIEANKPLNFLNQLHKFYGENFRTHKVDYGHMKDALESLNDHLDTEPYATQGIPIFSTLLQSSLPSRILLAFLNKEFGFFPDRPAHPGLSASYPFGSLGQFVDIRECSNDDAQKLDCNKLRKCRQEKIQQFSGL